jgi:hypothetical protein
MNGDDEGEGKEVASQVRLICTPNPLAPSLKCHSRAIPKYKVRSRHVVELNLCFRMAYGTTSCL